MRPGCGRHRACQRASESSAPSRASASHVVVRVPVAAHPDTQDTTQPPYKTAPRRQRRRRTPLPLDSSAPSFGLCSLICGGLVPANRPGFRDLPSPSVATLAFVVVGPIPAKGQGGRSNSNYLLAQAAHRKGKSPSSRQLGENFPLQFGVNLARRDLTTPSPIWWVRQRVGKRR